MEEIEGLGWLRTEAALSLEFVSLLKQAGVDRQSAQWAAGIQDARRLIRQLRSNDLQEELKLLTDD